MKLLNKNNNFINNKKYKEYLNKKIIKRGQPTFAVLS
jgi:hypothetical protein